MIASVPIVIVAAVLAVIAIGLRAKWLQHSQTHCADCWHKLAEHSYSCAHEGCCCQKSYWDLVGKDAELP